jgi:hypothetical protein
MQKEFETFAIFSYQSAAAAHPRQHAPKDVKKESFNSLDDAIGWGWSDFTCSREARIHKKGIRLKLNQLPMREKELSGWILKSKWYSYVMSSQLLSTRMAPSFGNKHKKRAERVTQKPIILLMSW